MSGPTNTKTQSDAIDMLLCRGELYAVLALLYRHPSSIRKESLLQEQRASWKEAVSLLNFPDKVPLETSMDLLLRDLDETHDQKWISLYEECFSHTAHGTVSSYELEYGEEHTHRQPQQLGDIAAFYQAFGLKISEKIHERVDHIAVECELMHFLLFKEAYALEHHGQENAEICRQASRRFLSEHLGQWAPSFAMRLAKYAREGLFKHLADVTLFFIVEDCRNQKIIPGPRDLPVRSVNEKVDTGCVSCSLKADLPC